MNPATHFLAGWSVASYASVEKRDRALITIAGIVPDIDGLGVVAEYLTRGSENPLYWWSDYHHLLTHNIGFGLFVTAAGAALARRRLPAALLIFLSFHLHLFGDIIGARGPDGFQWPIPYLVPFSDAWQLAWEGQWMLNAWPNFVITLTLLGLTFYAAWRWGISPLEMISKKANDRFVETLRVRFGIPINH